MLHVPSVNDFRWTSSTTNTRPAASYGTSITAGGSANTKGSYTQFSGGGIAEDAYGILINLNSADVNGFGRPMQVTIGKDDAGGTSYTDFINDLLCGNAAPYNIGNGGFWYYFPVFMKAGASLAAKAQCEQASKTVNIFAQLFGKPAAPEACRVGSFVRTFGADNTTSGGTAVTPGTASEGGYADLGTTADDLWWWQLGSSCDDDTMAAIAYHCDLAIGDASNKHLVLENIYMAHNGSEQRWHNPHGAYYQSKSGNHVYGRMQCSGTSDSGMTMAAYAVGG